MDSSSSHLATNQASAGQCTVYIDDDDKPGSCVCGHKFNFHTSAAHLDPFASLPVHRTRSTNTGNTPARDGTSDDVDESQEEDRLAEVERRFKHARSKGTADAAGHASLAYHAPAAGSLRPRASHTEALKEARKGLGGGNKGKGKSVSTKNSRKVKVKAEKENGDGRKGKSQVCIRSSLCCIYSNIIQVSGPVKALRVREIYFLPSGLKAHISLVLVMFLYLSISSIIVYVWLRAGPRTMLRSELNFTTGKRLSASACLSLSSVAVILWMISRSVFVRRVWLPLLKTIRTIKPMASSPSIRALKLKLICSCARCFPSAFLSLMKILREIHRRGQRRRRSHRVLSTGLFSRSPITRSQSPTITPSLMLTSYVAVLQHRLKQQGSACSLVSLYCAPKNTSCI